MHHTLKKKNFLKGKNLNKNKILFSLLGFIFFFPPISYAITSEEIAEEIEKKYNLLKDVSMEFVQRVESSVFSDTQEVKGMMYLKNPDMFKIWTKREAVISDGKYLWLYSEANNQVTKREIDKSKNIFNPNQYLYNFTKNYKPQLENKEKVGKNWCYKLVLSPKESEGVDSLSKQEAEAKDLFITKLILWVDKKTFLVKKLEYQDINDNLVSFVFSKIKTNSGIKDSEFVFRAPKGVEVVDLTR